MKRYTDMTNEELLALHGDPEAFGRTVDYECALEGVALLPPRPVAPEAPASGSAGRRERRPDRSSPPARSCPPEWIGGRPGRSAAPATGSQGMGPGMMGQGMGQGMGAGQMGQGMGPGMMGGMMGPGMMGGMMGQGMGPSMMGGAGPYAALSLSSEQRSKIAEIQQDLWRKQWDLMGKMHEERFHMHQLTSGAETDDGAVRKAYQVMADSHKQMFEAMLDTRKRIDAVLTKAQREKLSGGGRGG